jgi:hypothetical protein
MGKNPMKAGDGSTRPTNEKAPANRAWGFDVEGSAIELNSSD